MTGVTVTVDIREVTTALTALAKRVTDLTPAMDEIGAYMVGQKDLGFRAERDPWGNSWEPLKESTVARRRKRSNRILRDTGHLQDSIGHEPDKNSVTIGIGYGVPVMGSVSKYAGTHQFGLPKKNVPPRPFLPINPSGDADLSPQMVDDILAIITGYIDR